MIERLTLIAIVVGVGYFIWSDQEGRPSATDRALEAHQQLMERAGF